MDIAHRDHLVAVLRGLLGAATLLLCLLAELCVFVLQRHAVLYLAPVCAMLLLYRLHGRTEGARVNLVDFSCLKPPRRLRVPIPGLLEHLKLIGCFDAESVEFMSKVIASCGMGDETYFPPPLHYIPPSATHTDGLEEARMLFFPTLDELFAKTGVAPSAVGALVVNCSGFCPAPSLTAVIANHYAMCGDVKTYNLSGMGCAAGVIGVDVARSVLRTHAISYAVVVSAEIVSIGWYKGREHSKLLLNCFFRTGCAAALLTTTNAAVVPAKYRLVTLTRTNRAADDCSYRSASREEDDEGITGFSIGRGLGGVARELLRAHLAALGPSILPWHEKLRYAAKLLLSRRSHKKVSDAEGDAPAPDFRTAAKHFCLPSSGKPMIRRLAQGLGLGEPEAEAALMAFHRFGNQSAASLWYQLAYHEAKGKVRRGDRVWQLGMGSGPKANSMVWQRVGGAARPGGKPAAPAPSLGPWVDCIHRYPVMD